MKPYAQFATFELSLQERCTQVSNAQSEYRRHMVTWRMFSEALLDATLTKY